jgi:P27 family predicted phage terminase small subunit
MPRALKSREQHYLEGTMPQNVLPGQTDIPSGRPRYPKGLSPDAKKIFKELCRQLEDRRQLTRGDSELLRLYAESYERQREAQAKLAAEGIIKIYKRLDSNGQPHDVEKPNLWLAVAERHEKYMLAVLVQLGLTPAARARVRPLKSAEPVDDLDVAMNSIKPMLVFPKAVGHE